MTQPGRQLPLSLRLVRGFDVASLDKLLARGFDLDVPPFAPRRSYGVGNALAPMAEMGWRILVLGGYLLRQVRVPAFDPGRVLDIRPTRVKDQVGMLLLVPAVDHIPAKVSERAYRTAAQVIGVLIRRNWTMAQLGGLWEELNRNFVEPLSRQMPGANSTIPLLAAAHDKGIPFRHLDAGVYQLGWGSRAVRMDRSALETDSAIGLKLSNDKYHSASLMRSAGLPAADHIRVASVEAARGAAAALGWPVVVKPADRDRGEGVTVDVRDDVALRDAFAVASELSKSVLVERQVPGVCHRLFVSHGKLLFAVKRRPKGVYGDGLHRVTELVAVANEKEMAKPPWQRLKPFPLDELALTSLAEVGLTLESIPGEGVLAPLRPIQSTEWGGVVEEVTQVIHPDNIDLANRVAQLFALNSAGVDMISQDIGQPWHTNGAIVNEINYAPLLSGEAVAKAYLPGFIGAVIKDDGRIPVDLFIGGQGAWSAACDRQQDLVTRGVRCFLSSHRVTLLPSREERMLASESLYDRTLALLMDKGVEALVLVVQTDEFLHRGLPVDAITGVYTIDNDITSFDKAMGLNARRVISVLHTEIDAYRLESGSPRTGRELPFET